MRTLLKNLFNSMNYRASPIEFLKPDVLKSILLKKIPKFPEILRLTRIFILK